MCHGYSACEDNGDASYCSKDHELCGYDRYYTPCPGYNNTGHQECYLRNGLDNNGEFDCLGRGDERDLVIKKQIINYTSIRECVYDKLYYTGDKNVYHDLPGLLCGEDCVPHSNWCREDRSQSCIVGNSKFSTNNKILCQNSTFWSEHKNTCLDYVTGRIIGRGYRCSGRNTSCIHPAYANYNLNTRKYLVSSCEDKSDRIHKNNSLCTIDSYTDKYCNTFCPEGEKIITERHGIKIFIDKEGRKVRRGIKCDPLCVNTSAWLSANLDRPALVDPHHCQDSCSEPGYGCRACTNTSYFRCNISGEPHCIHPELVCDGQKTCDMGEDEELTTECIDKLVRLGDIDEAATKPCKSIQDPG